MSQPSHWFCPSLHFSNPNSSRSQAQQPYRCSLAFLSSSFASVPLPVLQPSEWTGGPAMESAQPAELPRPKPEPVHGQNHRHCVHIPDHEPSVAEKLLHWTGWTVGTGEDRNR
ncbi:hypothetical protein NE237_016135 [Protea cynaroides]|uniref:Uncharacterized protein n=1 Tax=Protea cynaroides TaxID=273540 RepID=A0A9Q0QRW0_9MAGN|nr:hypothetical protein NE237_016135 [Protea cynaroides]